jgi:Fe-S cluster assembly protein SufB
VNNKQQADTGTKMIHIGKNTRSTIVAKGISAGHAENTYRGLVRIHPGAEGARNYTRCDSLLIGPNCGAHTVPYIEVRNPRTSSTTSCRGASPKRTRST